MIQKVTAGHIVRHGVRMIALHIPGRKNRVLMDHHQWLKVAVWFRLDAKVMSNSKYARFLKRLRKARRAR